MRATSFLRSNILPCAGLIVPPMLWAINTELGQVLPYAECGSPLKLAALTSLPAAALSLGAGFLSWQATRRNRSDADLGVTAYPASFAFVGAVSGLAGALFAFALLLQGLSSLVLTGCER
jgi:hypothetical protein